MKKSFFLFIFSALLAFSLPLHCVAALYDPQTDDADIYYLISMDDDTVIAEKNADKKTAPASITKIVTAILTIENCSDLEQVVTVPSHCIRLLDGTNSSTAGILVDEELTVRQLLYCLLVYSANDAANILADFIGEGDIDAFVEMMNSFVSELGCKNTHFANAHGLDDPNHYSTARDLALIYQYCLKNSLFAEIAGTFTYDVPPTNKYGYTRYLRNTNNLLNPGIADYYYEYAQNGKTGTTDDAGRCLISTAAKDGYRYLCVVLNGKFYDFDQDGVDENMAFILSKKLYAWAFENVRLREVANPNVYVCEVPVRLSKEYDYVSLVPSKSVSALVPVNVGAESVYIEPYKELTATMADAPVKKGDILGKAAVRYAGETIAEVDLAAAFDVNRSTVKYIADILLQTARSSAFRLIVIIVFVVLLPVFILLFVIFPQNKKKKKNTVRMVNVKNIDSNKRRKD